MKKSEVVICEGCPALNIKVYGDVTQALISKVENDCELPGFASWYDLEIANNPDGQWCQWAWDAACEQGYEMAVDAAGEIFGADYGYQDHRMCRVWQTGRSGGWLYVADLPDLEEWTSKELSLWEDFSTACENLVDDIPYQFLWILANNTYAGECLDFAKAEELAEKISADSEKEYVHA